VPGFNGLKCIYRGRVLFCLIQIICPLFAVEYLTTLGPFGERAALNDREAAGRRNMTAMPYGEYGSKYNRKYGTAMDNYTSRTFTKRGSADFYDKISAATAKTIADNQSRANRSGIINKNVEDYLPEDNLSAEDDLSEDDLTTEKNSPYYFIRAKINEMYDKVMNNETEESFQIGANSFTVKEWNKLIEEFDDIQEKMRELMREEQERKQAKQEEREELADSLVESLREKDKNI